jgi:hypothetical protein
MLMPLYLMLDADLKKNYDICFFSTKIKSEL